MPLTIDSFKPGDEVEFCALVRRVFDEFVCPGYTAEGNRCFYDFIEPASMLDRHRAGNLLLAARDGSALLGMIEVRDHNHVCLLFVEKAWHGRGVAKRLLAEALRRCRDSAEPPQFVEVHASPYSERIYERLGFRKERELQESHGMKFVPMKMTLR